ncbi:hypothetical protein B9Q03_05040 [Candidatus Marsarchaeota G2 archaeon OSP_D]|uniref:Uncharacterized protein n=1 Tax=Candidatus Marsarchaeota G2 archaeon OSP_D TaxID=1978157 RepID=A0A2R6AXI5_9ARCH|nr:MAG: hypothetical protein B9Q03_05040 [Candidatus Marsarchaeota G2 archaeon OSP_D]
MFKGFECPIRFSRNFCLNTRAAVLSFGDSVLERQRFDFLNLSVRGLVVLLMTKKKGYICTQDVRKLYSLHKRSKRSAGFLVNMVENGHLKRVARDRYVLTPKAELAIDLLMKRLQLLTQQEIDGKVPQMVTV